MIELVVPDEKELAEDLKARMLRCLQQYVAPLPKVQWAEEELRAIVRDELKKAPHFASNEQPHVDPTGG